MMRSVRVDPFVTSIPAEAFSQRKNLTEVELGARRRGNWGQFLHRLQQFNNKNQHPQLTKED